MDIQNKEALIAEIDQFKKTQTFKYFYSTLLYFDESLNCFVATEKWRDKEAELLTAAWWMFAELAKAQAVPEGFVLIPKVFPEEKALNLAKQKTEEQSKRIDDKFRHGIEYSENKKASISRDKVGAMKNLHTDFFLMIEELEQK